MGYAAMSMPTRAYKHLGACTHAGHTVPSDFHSAFHLLQEAMRVETANHTHVAFLSCPLRMNRRLSALSVFLQHMLGQLVSCTSHQRGIAN